MRKHDHRIQGRWSLQMNGSAGQERRRSLLGCRKIQVVEQLKISVRRHLLSDLDGRRRFNDGSAAEAVMGGKAWRLIRSWLAIHRLGHATAGLASVCWAAGAPTRNGRFFSFPDRAAGSNVASLLLVAVTAYARRLRQCPQNKRRQHHRSEQSLAI